MIYILITVIITALISMKFDKLFNSTIKEPPVRINNKYEAKSYYPSENETTAHLALLKIRSHEVACTYHLIRRFQRKASKENSNWIKLFLEYCFDLYTLDDFTPKTIPLEKIDPHKLFEERFRRIFSGAPYDLNEKEFIDLQIAIAFNHTYPSNTLKRLKNIHFSDSFNGYIDRLIKVYEKLIDVTQSGNYEKIFFQKNFSISNHQRILYKLINSLWEEIIEHIKTDILILKTQNLYNPNKEFYFDQSLEEIKHTDLSTFSIENAMCDEDSKRSYIYESEKYIFNSMKTNPFSNLWNFDEK